MESFRIQEKPLKAGFYTPYESILREDSDRIHVLTEPLMFYSARLRKWFKVPVGFQSDQSSVPRVPVIYTIWGDRSHREGVLHDFVFRIGSDHNLEWWECNELFLEAMQSRGKSPFICYPMYWGVVIGSYSVYHTKTVMQTL